MQSDKQFFLFEFSTNHLNFPVPPMLMIMNQLVGSAIGQKIVLECQSEAFPKSINYWMKNETIITKGKQSVCDYVRNWLRDLMVMMPHRKVLICNK